MKIRLKELAEVIGGEVRQGKPGLMLNGVSTDSRAVSRGNVFFALKGERFDGHQFVKDVEQKGAFAAVVRRDFSCKLSRDFGLVSVSDPLYALGELARFKRAGMKAKVIGITGSVGKTTTKEMVSLVLSEKFKTVKSEGNFNNLIGVPLTILKIPVDTEVAVLELASNQRGEIARLSEIAQPDIGVITRISEAHLMGLKDLDGVEREKRALMGALGTGGIFVFNSGDPRLCRLAMGFAGRKAGFGLRGERLRVAEIAVIGGKIQKVIQGQKFLVRVLGKKEERSLVEICGLGEHLVEDALCAIAVGRILGVSLKQSGERLKCFKPMPGRGSLENIWKGVWLLDESYNANPESMRQALKVFSEYSRMISGKKILVLGEMLELGESGAKSHQELGEFLQDIPFDELFYTGSFEKELALGLGKYAGKKLRMCKSLEQIEEALKLEFCEGLEQGLILLKGSHGIGLWNLARALRERSWFRRS